MMIRIILYGLLLFLASCTASQMQDVAIQASGDLTRIINSSLALEPSERLDYLKTHLGQPERTADQSAVNPHVRGQQDVIRTLEYPGVTLTTYVLSASGEEHLLKIEVRSPHYATPEGIHVGARVEPREDLTVVWQDAQVTTYLLPHPDGAPNFLTLWHEGETVNLITWEFYAG